MNAKQQDLLDDIDAWRNARLARTRASSGFAVEVVNGNAEPVTIIGIKSGKFSRWDAEPEMVEVLRQVEKVFNLLEPAREAIIERKLRELLATNERTL